MGKRKMRAVIFVALSLLFCASVFGAVAVDYNSQQQIISGFGASSAWSEWGGGSAGNAWLVSHASDFFGSGAGEIGLSIIRSRIPPDTNQWGSTAAPLQAARDLGVTRIMATAWTPPAAWKSNGAVDNQSGAYLLTSHYQDYANYLRDYVNTMKNSYNVDIYAVSPANEPDYQVGYDGCTWSGAQLADFVANYLGPTFAAAGLTTKIMVGESFSNNLAITDPSLTNATARGYTDIVAAHIYGGGPRAYPLSQTYNKEYWMTEMSEFNAYDPSMAGMGLTTANWIHNSLVNAEFNAFIYWWLSTDANNEGLTSETLGTPKRFYVMGNFSRFVKPGFYRIDATAAPATGVKISAYKDPSSGKLVIVAINTNGSSSNQTFNISGFSPGTITPWITDSSRSLAEQAPVTVSGGSFTYNLPSQSVVSFVTGGVPTSTMTPTPTGTWFTDTPTFTATQTATPLTDLVDDLEDGNNTNVLGGNWYNYAGTGTTLTSTPFSPESGDGAPGSTSYNAHLQATVADYAGVGTNLNAAETGVDLTDYDGLEFWVKGNGGDYWFQFTQTNITDGDHHGLTFSAPATWTKVTILFVDIDQRGWGTAAPFTQDDIVALQWGSNGNGALDFRIDDVALIRKAGAFTYTPTETETNTPPPADTFTPTATYTATQTFTPGGTGKDYCLTVDYSAVPALVNRKNITLKVNVGQCTGVSVMGDGSPVAAVYNSGTGEAIFTTDAENIVVTALGWVSGGTGAATIATLQDDHHWAMSQTFDDEYLDVYQNAKPLLDAKGWKAGIAVVASWESQSWGPQMSWAQMQTLLASGWDIYNHTYTHPNLDCANFQTEFDQNQTLFQSNFPGYNVNHIVYPYEDTSASSCSGFAPSYLLSGERAAGMVTNYVDAPISNLYLINRTGQYGTDNSTWKTNAANAAANGRENWVIMITHHVYPGGTLGSDPDYSTTANSLSDFYDYLDTNFGPAGDDSMWFAPAGTVMDYIFTRDNAVVSVCSGDTPTETETAAISTDTFTSTHTETSAVNTFTPTPTFTVDPSAAVISWNTQHQVMSGFGASSAWSEWGGGSAGNAWLVSHASDFFGTGAGEIGLSIIRSRIPPDTGQWGSTAAPLQAARDLGVTRIMATAWTPPAAWKSNGAVDNQSGAYLLPANYQNYANYLRDYVIEMRDVYGVDIYAVSPANEPDYMVGYDGCTWSGAQLADFVGNYMGPAFAAAGLTTKIMVGESFSNNLAITNDTLNNATARGYTDIIGAHIYGGGPTYYPLQQTHNKEYWMTEMSEFNAYDPSMAGMGLTTANWIHNSLVSAEFNAFVYWWLSTDANNEGLTSETMGTPKRFYAMGNYSKFVKPGYFRIDATEHPAGGLNVSAYKDETSGSLVIVVINTGTSGRNQNFQIQGTSPADITPWITDSSRNLVEQASVPVTGGSFTYNIPAQSVVSFVAGGLMAPTVTGTPTGIWFTDTPTETATNTPTPMTELIDDLEDGDTVNIPGGDWYNYAGTGTTLTSTPFMPESGDGAPGSTSYNAHLQATVADYAGVGTNLNAAETGVDLTNYDGIEFWVKGNGGDYWFQFTQTSITDGDHHGLAFNAPAAWTKVTILFADIDQRGWGTAAPFTQNDIIALQWSSNGNGALDFQIDDIALILKPGVPTKTPTVIYTGTPTETETYADTETETPVDTQTETFTETQTETETPVDTETETPTITDTVPPGSTDTYTPTETNTAFDTETETFTQTETETAVNTETETFTYTDTVTETPTITDTVPPGSTDTYTPTETQTAMDTQTETFTQTDTETPVPTESETPTITDTVPPGSTDTYTPTETNTAQNTATETFTRTYTMTATSTPTLSINITLASPSTINAGIDTDLYVYFNNNRAITSIDAQLQDFFGAPLQTVTLPASAFSAGSNNIIIPLDDAVNGFDLAALASDSYRLVLIATNGVDIAVSPMTLLTINGAPTATETPTTIVVVSTDTYTPTATNTAQDTATYTYTYTPTETATAIIPTPTPTQGDTLEITELLPYPNPFNPNIPGVNARFGFKISRTDLDRISLRMYTSSYRLVREVVFEQAAMAQVISRKYIEYNAEDLANMANGTYYYYILAVKDGKEVRSKVDKVIILK